MTTFKFAHETSRQLMTTDEEHKKLELQQILDSCIVKAKIHTYDIRDHINLLNNQLEQFNAQFDLVDAFSEVFEVYRVSAQKMNANLTIDWSSNVPKSVYGDKRRLQ